MHSHGIKIISVSLVANASNRVLDLGSELSSKSGITTPLPEHKLAAQNLSVCINN